MYNNYGVYSARFCYFCHAQQFVSFGIMKYSGDC